MDGKRGGSNSGLTKESNSCYKRFNMKWRCQVTGKTIGVRGNVIRMKRYFDGVCWAGDMDTALLKNLKKKRNLWDWLGCELTITTPIGWVFKRVLEVESGEYKLIKG